MASPSMRRKRGYHPQLLDVKLRQGCSYFLWLGTLFFFFAWLHCRLFCKYSSFPFLHILATKTKNFHGGTVTYSCFFFFKFPSPKGFYLEMIEEPCHDASGQQLVSPSCLRIIFRGETSPHISRD